MYTYYSLMVVMDLHTVDMNVCPRGAPLEGGAHVRTGLVPHKRAYKSRVQTYARRTNVRTERVQRDKGTALPWLQ